MDNVRDKKKRKTMDNVRDKKKPIYKNGLQP